MGSCVDTQHLKYDAICFETTERKMQISGAIKTAANIPPAWPGHPGLSVKAHLGHWGHTKAFSSPSFESVNSEAIQIKGGTAIVCPLSTCINVLCITGLFLPYTSHAWHVFPLF